MKTPYWWHQGGLAPRLLTPLSYLWQAGAKFRSYRAHPEKLTAPLWCVGNVAAGGGGKTPFCLWLGTHAQQAGVNAYFISRGYGGQLAGPLRVDPATHTAAQVGDEALLLAGCLPTIIARNRRKAAHFAIQQGATLLIMDDGLQYPHLHKDKSFLLLKGAQPLGNGRIIPAGPLRESFSAALSRSDVVVQVDASTPLTLPLGKPLWQARSKLTIPHLHAPKALAFAGIAHPDLFRRQLVENGVDLAGFHAFADHYAYQNRDMESLLQHAAALGAALLTTQKDAVRIPPAYADKIAIVSHELMLEAAATTEIMREITSLSPRQ